MGKGQDLHCGITLYPITYSSQLLFFWSYSLYHRALERDVGACNAVLNISTGMCWGTGLEVLGGMISRKAARIGERLVLKTSGGNLSEFESLAFHQTF